MLPGSWGGSPWPPHMICRGCMAMNSRGPPTVTARVPRVNQLSKNGHQTATGGHSNLCACAVQIWGQPSLPAPQSGRPHWQVPCQPSQKKNANHKSGGPEGGVLVQTTPLHGVSSRHRQLHPRTQGGCRLWAGPWGSIYADFHRFGEHLNLHFSLHASIDVC